MHTKDLPQLTRKNDCLMRPTYTKGSRGRGFLQDFKKLLNIEGHPVHKMLLVGARAGKGAAGPTAPLLAALPAAPSLQALLRRRAGPSLGRVLHPRLPGRRPSGLTAAGGVRTGTATGMTGGATCLAP